MSTRGSGVAGLGPAESGPSLRLEVWPADGSRWLREFISVLGASLVILAASWIVSAAVAHGAPLGQANDFAVPTLSSSPYAVTAGPDGNLWFTEYNASKIGEINPLTHATSDFATPTASSEPFAITVGPDGNIWFTETIPSMIGEINPVTHATSDFATPTSSSNPSSITVGPDGNIWFAEFNASRIGEMNPVTHATSDFATPTAFASPYGIVAGEDGALWFIEHAANRVGEIGAGMPAASLAAPVVAGGGQAGIPQVCEGAAWANFAFQQPLVSAAFWAYDGYGWLRDGSAIAGATAQAYTPGPGDVGHQLSCIATVTYALTQTPASATSAAVTVIAQNSGPAGANGTNGTPGANGEIELVTCTSVKKKVKGKTKTVKKCTTQLTSSPVSFTTASARATVSRGGHVYATGALREGKLTLRISRALRAGRYVLTLTTATGRDKQTTRQSIMVGETTTIT